MCTAIETNFRIKIQGLGLHDGSNLTVPLLLHAYYVQFSSCTELLRQHISSGTVCDPTTGKWHDISDVCYLVTANCSTPHQSRLPPQLLKEFVVVQWDEYR